MIRHAGFSIVELMVALTVGLIIIAGVGQVFVSNKNAYRYIEGATSLQDQGNMALEIIAQQLDLAGFIHDESNPRFDSRTNKPAAEELAFGANILPLDGLEGGAGSDTLIVNAIPANGVLLDCVNTSHAAADFTGSSGGGITNRIEIKNGSGLYCNDVEVVPGIEHMQVTYGLTVINAAGIAETRYLKRNDPLLATRADMALVNSVRIALLVSTEQQVRPTDNPVTNYTLLDATVSSPTDRRMRKVFETTIRLRNRCALVPNLPVNLCA